LPALLSRVLLSFALECERESELSLAISANVLRVYHQVLAAIEQRWHKRFTGRTISALRASLEVLVTAPDSERPPSFPGRPPSFHGLPPISPDSSPIRTTGAHRSVPPAPCRGTRWSCTVVATPTAADPAKGLTGPQHVVTRT